MDFFLMGMQDLSFVAQASFLNWGVTRFPSLLKNHAASLQHFEKLMASQGATNWHSMHVSSALCIFATIGVAEVLALQEGSIITVQEIHWY